MTRMCFKLFILLYVFVSVNNYNQYLIQLLLHSKYLVTEQNLAVHFCQHFVVN